MWLLLAFRARGFVMCVTGKVAGLGLRWIIGLNPVSLMCETGPALSPQSPHLQNGHTKRNCLAGSWKEFSEVADIKGLTSYVLMLPASGRESTRRGPPF